jgi:ADP-heptose:LPS heptosyltransferase
MKTACVVRYGVIGDMIVTSSILPGLKEQGYHVTVNTYQIGRELLKHDPHVDEFLIHKKDEVPNTELGDYWKKLAKNYDRFINLSESMEGSLLALQWRIAAQWPKEARAFLMDRNYLEMTHAIAGVPFVPRAKFYATKEEREWARKEKAKWGKKFVIFWSLSGSALHKVSPWADDVMHRLFANTDDAVVVLTGGHECQILEVGWENHPRVWCRSGVWSIRKSLAFAQAADLVVGTETGVLNAVGLENVPKIVLLSHSSPEMLTKHWKNTTNLIPSTPCHPCRILHQNRDNCPAAPSGTSRCMEDITEDQIYRAIITVHDTTKMREMGYEHSEGAGHRGLGLASARSASGG